MRRVGWVVVVSLGWALACGGRFQRGGEDEDGFGGIPTGQGGSAQSQAGTPNRSGAPSGGSGGGLAIAGTGNVGTGGGCACDPIDTCPPGYLSVPSPSGCCFECQLDYKSCDEQRTNYAYFRESVLRKHAPYKCTTAADCLMYYDQNDCQVSSCGALIDVASWNAVDVELYAFARMNCNFACPPPPVPPCVPAPEPLCFRGYCE